MATTIDALVVTLGLDAKGFASGVRGSAEQLAGFTRRLAGMFIAIRGLDDVVGYFQDLHRSLSAVGFQSRNLGVMGTQLLRLGEVSERFGGQMQDAAETVQGLQASIFNLRFRGQLSDQLLMLQRFGVAYLNRNGTPRNFLDVARDAARVIDQQSRRMGLDAGQRYQMALSFGFTGGIASAVSQGLEGFDKNYQKAVADQKRITEGAVKRQVDATRALISNSFQMKGVASAILDRLTPALITLSHDVTLLAGDIMNSLIPILNKWVPKVDTSLKDVEGVIGGKKPMTVAGKAASVAMETYGALGTIGTEEIVTSFLGKRFGLLAAGKEALQGHFANMFKLVASVAVPEAGVGFGAEEVLKNKAPSVYNALDSWTNLWNALKGSAPATPNAPRPVSPGGGSVALVGGGGTNVQIDNIEIITQAKDSAGIAASLQGALKRKLTVASADGGQQ